MNLKLEYFTDRALATLELAIDESICGTGQTLFDGQMELMVEWHRLVVEERMRRESAMKWQGMDMTAGCPRPFKFEGK